MTSGYRGRFAPSPTGPLHAGSMVAALASWLDARAHGGSWLVRIEDVDVPRCDVGHADRILAQLAACGMLSDEPPWCQSRRGASYQTALDRLLGSGHAYPCACSRRDVEQANAALGRLPPRGGELIYPGTCRSGLHGRAARAWRFALPVDRHVENLEEKQGEALVQSALFDMYSIANADQVCWTDRRLGAQCQHVAAAVGDFVLRRADGLWAYQLAVVADDAAQAITDVVRGEDLADNTARQILLQRALGVPTPRYLHTPLVVGPDGEKLSKQNGAVSIDETQPLGVLNDAAAVLGLAASAAASVADALAGWVGEWHACCGPSADDLHAACARTTLTPGV